MSISRASTLEQAFYFTDDPDEFSKIHITYKQRSNIVIEKNKADLAFTTVTESGTTYYRGSFTFTQKEANLFDPNVSARVQVRVLTTTGLSYPSQIETVDINQVLCDEVL